MKKKIIIASIVVVVLGLFYFLSRNTKVETADSKKEKITTNPFTTTIVKKVITTGIITPKKEVDIKPQVSGIVETIYVVVGQKVKKGDPLLKIKLVPDLENLNSAESGLRIAKINLDDSYRELERQKKLFAVGAIAETELIKYTKDNKIKEEDLKSAENRLQLIKEGMTKEFTQTSNVIVATCDGMVLEILAKEGRSVMGRSNFNEGTTLLSIADMNQLVFQGKVGEAEVGNLKPGMEIELTIGAIENEKFKGIIELIAPKGKDEQGSVKFEFTASVLPKEGKMIRAGYSANAVIVLDKKENVLALNEGDLQFSNDSAYVEVKNKSHVFEKKYITTGISDGINIEIKSGLSKNDEVKIVVAKSSNGISVSL